MMFSKTLQKCFDQNIQYVVIGASAGGVEAIKSILSHLQDKNPLKIAIVLHMPPTGLNLMNEILKDYCNWDIVEATSGQVAELRSVTLAAPDYHLSLEADGSYSLSSEEPLNFSRPSIDMLFESAAFAFGKQTLGILLTGANQDGASGMKRIQQEGGLTIVQDPKEASSSTMPEAAINLINPDEILSINDITRFLTFLTSGATHA